MTQFRPLLRLLAVAASALLMSGDVCAQQAGQQASSRVIDDELLLNVQDPIEIRVELLETTTWQSTPVHLLTGDIRLQQGDLKLTASSAALFVANAEAGFDVVIYAEDAVCRTPDGTRTGAVRTLHLQSLSMPAILAKRHADRPVLESPLLTRALQRLDPTRIQTVSQTAFQIRSDSFLPPVGAAGTMSNSPGTRRIQIRPRTSSQPLSFDLKENTNTVPEEQVLVISGGVNVLVEGIEVDVRGVPVRPGIVDLSADQIVIWMQGSSADGLQNSELLVQPAGARFQIYMEGNIVIRQNQNTISASHAFFDANNDRAMLMNAELRTTIPTSGGDFRLRAERLRQLSKDRFHAQNAWATTSPYGDPGYRIQASDIFVEPGMSVPWTGLDPLTGRQSTGQATWVTSLNNQFIVGDTPVMWLPKLSGPIEDPGIPIRRGGIRQDRIFGLKVTSVWDLSRILGMEKRPGTEWDLLADYATKRGVGVGVQGKYNSINNLGREQGEGRFYYQNDTGKDVLGLGRNGLIPETEHRGEILWRHRQQLPEEGLLFGEIGYLSDRNYLEQYDEYRFDRDKDVETIFGARQDYGAYSGQLWARPQLYDFEANTEWLPRADLYSFSQSMLGGLAYWSSHTSAGYAQLNAMEPPANPSDPFTPLGLPYMTNAQGVVAMTRHEVDAPFQLGPVTIDPFVMGEAAYWGEGTSGAATDRYLLNAGVRARLMASKVMPFVRSDIFNLNGLAHKSETFFEYSYTDSTRGINEIPQYNEIDENSQERFRTHYTTQIYPGAIPAQFNPRNYAIRNGAGLWVSAPYHELADDFQVLRLSFRNRLQTKAGPPGSQRIRDWMMWESGFSYFPDASRDNFGEDIGLIYSHYRWNISDRTSLLTDSMWDLFSNAQN
ncbi:MAG: hypothetical protein KDA85_03345, partial [Planctomycetaceae bacterium]|nr:hypothetical protein [Planctomycetaceae bacterium]